MLKALLGLLLIFISSVFLFSRDFEIMKKFEPEIINLRNTKAGTLKMIEYLKNELISNTNSYDLYWKLSLAAYYYGNFYETNRDKKKEIFSKSRDYALTAVKINPNGVDGHYWLGVAYGLWSAANGILESFFYADEILDEMNKVIALQPDYFAGMPWAVRAKVYYYIPSFLYGSKEKAYQDMKTALKYGPDFRINYEYYAEILVNDGKYEEASKIIEKGINLPLDNRISLEENYSLVFLKQYQKIVNEKLKK